MNEQTSFASAQIGFIAVTCSTVAFTLDIFVLCFLFTGPNSVWTKFGVLRNPNILCSTPVFESSLTVVSNKLFSFGFFFILSKIHNIRQYCRFSVWVSVLKKKLNNLYDGVFNSKGDATRVRRLKLLNIKKKIMLTQRWFESMCPFSLIAEPWCYLLILSSFGVAEVDVLQLSSSTVIRCRMCLRELFEVDIF
ncbi:hypothetical protein AGLY_015842 [Aphis glycines]|uniref:Uncharacterized protein n=1 Tax=Aphis glycines TaxID=307491 RepID=A0A6G0SZU8_APHGL|nr:hypothetical protein AGLY_015842 [Aphis glycines]